MSRGQLSWGVVDQAFCSGTNLGLSIVAGRLLGPDGLGVVYVGFAVYLFLQSLQRSLISDPLTVHIATLTEEEARKAVGYGLTLALAAAAASSLFLGLASVAPVGPLGQSVRLFVPWIGVALLQDFCRSAMFASGKGGAATLNDGARAVLTAVALVVGWRLRSDEAIVAAWGLGAAVGTWLGFVQLRVRAPLRRLRLAWRWWCREAMPLGRWLGLEAVVISSSTLGITVILASLLSNEDVGGLRAVLTLFAPMTFLSQAIELPAVPRLARLCQVSISAARVAAVRLSAVAVALLGAYLTVAFALRHQLLTLVYGDEFRVFDRVILPVATSELLYGLGIGSFVLLKASGRGASRLLSEGVAQASTLVLVFVLAVSSGLLGAAWALAAGAAAGQATATLLALRSGRFIAQVPAER